MFDSLLYCLRLLKRRLYSRQGLDESMRRRGVGDEEREKALARLEEMGLINDRHFAEAWVRTRDKLAPRGSSLLRLELMKKGIDKALISEVLANRKEASVEGESPDEVELGRQLLKGRERLYAGLPEEVRRRRAMSLLMRRGFSYEVIRRIMDA